MKNKMNLVMIIGIAAALSQTILGYYNSLTIATIICCLIWFIIGTFKLDKD